CFFFSSRRRHTRSKRDWSSDVCSSDLRRGERLVGLAPVRHVGAGGGLSLYDVGSFVTDPVLDLQPSAISAISGASPPLLVDERRSEERRVGKECRCGWAAERWTM